MVMSINGSSKLAVNLEKQVCQVFHHYQSFQFNFSQKCTSKLLDLKFPKIMGTHDKLYIAKHVGLIELNGF